MMAPVTVGHPWNSRMISQWTWLLSSWIILMTAASAERPPEFVTEPESRVVKQNAQVVLNCAVEPADSDIWWLFNGQKIETENELGIRINGGNLEIDSFWASKGEGDPTHVGIYQCVGSNSQGTVVSKEALLDKTALRHFDADLQDVFINATKGNVALIPCEPPRAHPPALTRFELNGTEVDHTSRRRHRVLPSGSLQIADVRESDQGTYRCIAYNVVNGKERVAPNLIHLKVMSPVTDSIPRFIRRPVDTQVTQGHNLTLECLVEGSPVPIVTWDKYGGHLPNDRYSQVLGNLIIHNARTSDQGTYICQTENGVGIMLTQIANVEVLERPSVRISPPSKDVTEGGRVTFYCHTRGYLRMQGEWLHNGEHVLQDEFITITDTELTINKVQEEHAGIYQCVGRSKGESAYASAWLRITTDAEMSDSAVKGTQSYLLFSSHLTNVSTLQGDNVTLTCPVNSDLSVAGVAWYKDGDLVRRSTQEGASESLEITGVDFADAGEYFCNVTLKQGFIVASATMSVSRSIDEEIPAAKPPSSSVPSEPQNTIINSTANPPRRSRPREGNNRGRDNDDDLDSPEGENADDDDMVPPSRPEVRKLSDQSVMLIWSVPENNGLEIVFFKVQYRKLGGSKRGWITPEEDIDKDTTMHEVSGLSPGEYKFRVVAVYSNNDNKQGSSQRFTLARGPSPNHSAPLGIPMIVVIEKTSSDTLTIQWRYDVMESSIEGFYIYYKPYHSQGEYQRLTHLYPDSRQYVMTNLQPNTEYSFKIKSFNTAGESEFSYPVVEKTLTTSGVAEVEPPRPTNILREYTTTKKGAADDSQLYPHPRPQSSNNMLYMVLGIVLGVMLLLLLVFMVMCWWKQRQQRRLMTAIDERNKFNDPSRTIYNDSMRKKQHMNGGSHFLLNGLNGTNGHIPNGHGPHHQTNGGTNRSNMNININPMTDLDADSKEQYSLQELRSSLQEVLQQPPPPPPPNGMIDSNCNSMRPACRSPHEHYYEDPDNMDCCDHHHHHHHHCDGTCGSDHATSTPYTYPPPDYNSFSTFNKSAGGNRSHDHLLHNGSHDCHMTAAARTVSPDHIPRSYERPYRSHDRSHDPTVWASHDHGQGSHDHLSEHSHSSSSQASGRQRKRRRCQPESDSGGTMKDQATNTDISSNEGTLDSRPRHHRARPPKNLPYLPSPGSELPENDGGQEGGAPYYHHFPHPQNVPDPTPPRDGGYVDYRGESPIPGESPSSSENSPCIEQGGFPQDLPRVNDYSQSENDDDDDAEENRECDVFIRR